MTVSRYIYHRYLCIFCTEQMRLCALQKRQAYDLETSFASTSVPFYRKGALLELLPRAGPTLHIALQLEALGHACVANEKVLQLFTATRCCIHCTRKCLLTQVALKCRCR